MKLILVGPGELQIGLDIANITAIQILRSEQEDLTISFAENRLAKGDWQRLSDTLSATASSQTIRTYMFQSLQGDVPCCRWSSNSDH